MLWLRAPAVPHAWLQNAASTPSTPFATSHMPSLLPHAARSVSQRAAIGIDLGTSNSAVAVIEDGVPGMLHTSTGSTTIPSLLAYDACGALQAVGREVDAAHSFYSIKRLIGLSHEDAKQRTGNRLLYDIVCGPDGNTWLHMGDLPPLDVVDATAQLLQHIAHAARNELGGAALDAVVIGVPAHFDQSRRSATLLAAMRAGLENVQLLQGSTLQRVSSAVSHDPKTPTEPVAAALAYGVSSATRHETVLVFDLGGGTFDCSLLSTFAGIAEVLTTDGDQWLGGDDWDLVLADMLCSAVPMHTWDTRALRAAARDAKVELSTAEQVTIKSPSALVVVGRREWETATSPLLQRTLMPLRRLGEAGFVEWKQRCGCGITCPGHHDEYLRVADFILPHVLSKKVWLFI